MENKYLFVHFILYKEHDGYKKTHQPQYLKKTITTNDTGTEIEAKIEAALR